MELQTHARQYCNVLCLTTIPSTLSYQSENDVVCYRQLGMLQCEKMAAGDMTLQQSVIL